MNITVEQLVNSGGRAHLQRWWDQANALIKSAPNEEEAENIRSAMGVRRSPDTITGFLTKEKAWNIVSNRNLFPEAMLLAVGLSMIDDGKVFFLTDDMTFGYLVLPEKFLRCTFGLPLVVRGENTTSLDPFIDTFARDMGGKPMRYIASLEELVEYVNTNY
jgi:hypothetical protein